MEIIAFAVFAFLIGSFLGLTYHKIEKATEQLDEIIETLDGLFDEEDED